MGAALIYDPGKYESEAIGSFFFDVAATAPDLSGKKAMTLPTWLEPVSPAGTLNKADFKDTKEPLGYFHLLCDRDFVELLAIAEVIVQQLGEIVTDFYQRYLVHFGDSGTLGQDEFARIFKEALQCSQSAVLGGDIDRYAMEVSRLGELLAAKRIPLDEIITLVQLFKDSIERVLPQQNRQAGVARAFDKLHHVQIILLVAAYSRSNGAIADQKSTVTQAAPADLPGADEARFHGLVGAAPSMQQLYQRIEAAATSRGNLLIVGESGTGKELVARAVHECSARAERPFVALNCAALPKDLIESELFGYKRGAFSGATSEHLGLFRAADGGTLFLDEITEMSAETQSKLLRAIQERAIRQVGSTREQPVDIRVIASTNRDPQAAVADGHLRQDLYYRLQAAVISVPPLRERLNDIPLLVEHFMVLFQQDLGRSVSGIEQRALDALSKYSWPGNVRELSNAVEGAITFGRDHLILVGDLPPGISAARDAQVKLPKHPVPADYPSATATFAETERVLIARALQNNNGNKVQAAAELKISRKKLYAKIAKYGICAVQTNPPAGGDGDEASR
jgi:two-component system response regulator HydG